MQIDGEWIQWYYLAWNFSGLKPEFSFILFWKFTVFVSLVYYIISVHFGVILRMFSKFFIFSFFFICLFIFSHDSSISCLYYCWFLVPVVKSWLVWVTICGNLELIHGSLWVLQLWVFKLSNLSLWWPVQVTGKQQTNCASSEIQIE